MPDICWSQILMIPTSYYAIDIWGRSAAFPQKKRSGGATTLSHHRLMSLHARNLSLYYKIVNREKVKMLKKYLRNKIFCTKISTWASENKKRAIYFTYIILFLMPLAGLEPAWFPAWFWVKCVCQFRHNGLINVGLMPGLLMLQPVLINALPLPGLRNSPVCQGLGTQALPDLNYIP